MPRSSNRESSQTCELWHRMARSGPSTGQTVPRWDDKTFWVTRMLKSANRTRFRITRDLDSYSAATSSGTESCATGQLEATNDSP